MDIVEWLRDYYHMDSTRYKNTQIADEIERLREENAALLRSADDVYKRLMPEVERLREDKLEALAAVELENVFFQQEIERLRKALKRIEQYDPLNSNWQAQIARAALKGDE